MVGFKEFFQDAQGYLSMGRLLLFGSFLIASTVMILLAYMSKMSEGYMTIYMSAYAGTYAFSKDADRRAAAAAIQAGAQP